MDARVPPLKAYAKKVDFSDLGSAAFEYSFGQGGIIIEFGIRTGFKSRICVLAGLGRVEECAAWHSSTHHMSPL